VRVLVVGATGPTGRGIVANALAAGHDVTALVRDPARLDPASPGVRAATGDVLDQATLGPALAGQEAVISALGSTFTRKPTELVSAGTLNVISAMQQAGTRRLICITGFGAGDSRGHLNFMVERLALRGLLSELYKDKDRQEDLIRQSGVDWVIVRPVRLTNGAASGFTTTTDMTSKLASKVSRADVAAFCVSQLTDDTNLGQAVAVCASK
jgi:uncharacterized protein YbjT (DUF2867 family)